MIAVICFMKRKASIAFGPSEGVTDEHPLFQYAFFKASSIGDYFTNTLILSVGYPFSHVIKCWCGTIATRFSQVAQRDSHDFCRFSLLDVPSRWRRRLHVVCAI